MTVLENVLVGMHGQTRSSILSSVLRRASFCAEEREARERALKLLSLFRDHLEPRAGEFASSLSYANKRRLEIVRALATGASVLLLDEPAAGMNPSETEELMEDIVRLRDEGRTVLLIEHDMVVISRISDLVVALENGSRIASGSFEEVRSNPRVIEAYLGRGAAGRAGDSSAVPGTRPSPEPGEGGRS